MRYLLQFFLLSSVVSLHAQSSSERIFDEAYGEFKSIKTLMFNATLVTSGKHAGKTADVDGRFSVQKKGLAIEKFRHVALIDVKFINSVFFEEIVYNGNSFYSYNFEKRKYENKGELYAEFEGKRKTRTAIFFYQDLADLYQEFESKKQSIVYSADSIGYNLSIPLNRDKGQAILYFEYNHQLPYKVIEYERSDNRDDYTTLNFTNVRLNIPFPDNYFETPNPKDAVENRNTTVSMTMPLLGEKVKDPLRIKTMAPEWVAIGQDSVEVKLSDFSGKVVVMDFWATWCAPCVKAMPMLQRIHEKYKDVVVLGFDEGENAVDLEEYKRKKHLNYTLLPSSTKISNAYKVSSLPTLYIIDQYGMIAYASNGYKEEDGDTLNSMIEMLLK